MPKPRLSVVPKSNNRDTDDIRQGLEDMLRHVISMWRDDPQMFDVKTVLATIQYGGMYLTRTGKFPDNESGTAGGTARKFAGAFKTNVARRGKADTGPSAYDFTPSDDEPNF